VPVVQSYLNLMDAQREGMFARLHDVDRPRLWERPAPGRWSAGEHLDHTRVLNRSFRRLFQAIWPMLWPVAWLRRGRDYEVRIDDVYQRPNMPTRVGVIWSPRFGPRRPAGLTALQVGLTREHVRIRRFFRDRDEDVLGNAYLWDPPIGWLNLIQALRVGIHHDQHHYRAVERILGLEPSDGA